MQDHSTQKLSTTVTIQKFDHELDPTTTEPILVETVVAKDGRVISRTDHLLKEEG